MKRGNDGTGISNSNIIEKGISFSSLSKAFLKQSGLPIIRYTYTITIFFIISWENRRNLLSSGKYSGSKSWLNGVYCHQSRYRTEKDVEVNPKFHNAAGRSSLSDRPYQTDCPITSTYFYEKLHFPRYFVLQ